MTHTDGWMDLFVRSKEREPYKYQRNEKHVQALGKLEPEVRQGAP
jgi:hypothetical protein